MAVRGERMECDLCKRKSTRTIVIREHNAPIRSNRSEKQKENDEMDVCGQCFKEEFDL